MADDPAFLFYPGDYLRDTQCLSEKAQVAYDRIMCEHMRNICITQAQLNFFTKKLSQDEKEELSMVLRHTDDGYQIAWVVFSLEKRRAYSESRRKNRLKTHVKDMKTYDSHMENENEIVNEDINRDENKNEINKQVKEIFEFWKIELCHPKTTLDKKRSMAVAARLAEGFTVERIKEAIQGIKRSPHNMGQNERHTVYDDLELICRSGANVDRFADMAVKTPVEAAKERMARVSIANLGGNYE